MARISSQGSIIMVSDNANAPAPVDIASATQAKPCVLTLATGGTAPVVGDIVVPSGTGWNSIEAMPFKVSVVAAEAITLEDSDTSREVAAFPAAGATLVVPAFLELCRSNFTANQPAGTTIDVTTLCDIAHRIIAGLPAIATWTAAGFYDCGDLALEAARDYYRSGEDAVFDVRLPDGCGFTFAGIVNTFDVTLGINAAVANTIGGQVDGRVSFYKTPAPGFVPLTSPQRRTLRPSTNARPAPARPAAAQPAAAAA
jgi:hypothetical protein